jgi:gluconolactonase
MANMRINTRRKVFSTFSMAAAILLLLSCGSSRNTGTASTASDTSVIAAGATPRMVAKQFSFTEGPAMDKEGNVFFTDQPNNKIWKYDTDGNLAVFMDSTGRSNGMYFDDNGNLLSCADEKNQIWSISKNKEVTVVLNDYSGKKLNGPNDLWVAPNGDIYFTDPYYQRSWWTRKAPEIEGQHVYRLPKGKKEPVRVIDSLAKPNGIIGTPDGKYLYVADIGGKKTYRYTILKDGSLGEVILFTNMGSDGMTLDNRGNVYLTGNGVTIFSPAGQKLAHVPLPGWTANVSFYGKQKDQLFITAQEAVYTLQMNVRSAGR